MTPGVTFRPRSSWVDPRFPVTGPASNLVNVDTAVIHYTAADDLIDGDPGEHADDLPAYFRAMQRNYVTARGYSLGYWFGVDWLGGVWQVRGWEFRSAANAGHNLTTCPILVLVDGNDMATPAAVRSVQAIIAEGQRLAGRPWSIKGHGQLRAETGVGTATACPGVGLRAQIAAGVFSPSTFPPPVPEDDDMPRLVYIAVPPPERHGQPWLYVADTEVREATTFDIDPAAGIPRRDFATVEAQWRAAQYDRLLARASHGS